MKLKIDKATLLTMQLFKARNEVRYYLNGIFFSKNGVVAATNGHCAAIGEHDNELKEDLIIEVNDKPKITNFHTAVIDTDSLTVDYLNENGWRVAIGICSIVVGKFPDIMRIIPAESKACDEIMFHANYLLNAQKAAKLFNPKFEKLRFKLTGNDNSAVAEIKSPQGKSCKIVVMPMRIK